VTEKTDPVPETRVRWQVALAIATIAGFMARRALLNPEWPTDFDQLWHGARALFAGDNPYAIVGPGRPFQWNWPLYYPLPAVLFVSPLALLPVASARIVFSTIAGAILGWALAPRIRTHWPMVLSASFIISASRTQWAPLLLAAAWLPAFGFLIAAKPSVGLASLASLSGRRLALAAGGCAAATVLSFAIQPGWLSSWLEAIRDAPHVQAAIATLPAGPLLALAALRWKRADARLFLALAIVPHTPSLYDLLVLFFVCSTFREALTLAVLTQALFWAIVFSGGSLTGFDSYAEALGRTAVFVVYLPVLIAILMRPNRATDPLPESTPSVRPGWSVVPTNWFDTVLLSLLIVGGALQVMLPFSNQSR
jgi:hypothetical protein